MTSSSQARGEILVHLSPEPALHFSLVGHLSVSGSGGEESSHPDPLLD